MVHMMMFSIIRMIIWLLRVLLLLQPAEGCLGWGALGISIGTLEPRDGRSELLYRSLHTHHLRHESSLHHPHLSLKFDERILCHEEVLGATALLHALNSNGCRWYSNRSIGGGHRQYLPSRGSA